MFQSVLALPLTCNMASCLYYEIYFKPNTFSIANLMKSYNERSTTPCFFLNNHFLLQKEFEIKLSHFHFSMKIKKKLHSLQVNDLAEIKKIKK